MKNLKSNPAAGRTWDHLRLAQGSDRSGTSFPDYSLLLARSVRRTIPAQIDKTKRQWMKGIEIGLKPLKFEANCNNHRLGKAHLDHLLENTGSHVGGIWSFSVCLFWFVQLNKWDVSVSMCINCGLLIFVSTLEQVDPIRQLIVDFVLGGQKDHSWNCGEEMPRDEFSKYWGNNVQIALINPLAIKYAIFPKINNKPPRNKVRQNFWGNQIIHV